MVVKQKQAVSEKRKKGALIKDVREVTHPDIFKVPKKNPTLHYRWLRNTPDNMNVLEAKGYQIATADEVRAAGLKPGNDGSCRRGDLVLAVESYAHHRDHREKQAELEKMRDTQMRRGLQRNIRAGGFDFVETVKQS